MYNEASIIAETAKTVSDYMAATFSDYEVLFSNDGSLDNSAEIVESLGLPNVRVVGYEKNQGKGCAVRTAMLAATGDIVMFTDADLAYGTEVVKLALDFIRTFPCGESEYCWLSYDMKNEGARALYRSFGFVEQTDVYVEGGEMPAVLKL